MIKDVVHFISRMLMTSLVKLTSYIIIIVPVKMFLQRVLCFFYQ